MWKFLLFVPLGAACAAPLPPRRADAARGKDFAARISSLSLVEREAAVKAEFTAGNVPDAWRKFADVKIVRTVDGREHQVTLRVAPDYLSIGSDQDCLLMPVTPATALSLAKSAGCTLPTRRMVQEIHRAAAVKLTPAPLPPGPEMTTVAVFRQHSDAVRSERERQQPGTLTSGHKKDVVLTPQLATAPGKVAIFGWIRPDGSAIQPLYLGHTDQWVDYSHGIRFVENDATLDGRPTTVSAILADPQLCELLSDEGPLPPVTAGPWPGEQVASLNLPDGVRALLHAPAKLRDDRPLRLVIYAAPAGNTVEQTMGRRALPGEDWHFDIQHIAAQTRWLRQHDESADLAVAVVQCQEKFWPAWRRKHDPDNRKIPALVTAIQEKFPGRRVELVLSGHSAGGSFVFGFLDAQAAIPAAVTRISFLDSNYAYSAEKGHAAKLAEWLRGDSSRCLCVLAYHDSHALLNGKPFVSESGGTWGRSHAMLRDLPFPFTKSTAEGMQRHAALDGRLQFLLKENPAREVLHTRLVEWNGFIHSMLTGTALEQQGYRYPAARVYGDLISEAVRGQ